MQRLSRNVIDSLPKSITRFAPNLTNQNGERYSPFTSPIYRDINDTASVLKDMICIFIIWIFVNQVSGKYDSEYCICNIYRMIIIRYFLDYQRLSNMNI